MTVIAARPAQEGLGRKVLGALVWRSGSQIFAQLVTWGATFLVIRLLTPADYGLFAMTQSVLALFQMLNGQSFASGLVRDAELDRRRVGQVFGLLILLNLALAAVQFAGAPLVADYFHQPAITAMLRVQCVLYAFNPLTALAQALLSREMEFRRQALVNFTASMAAAGTALLGALSGWGVWTLVAAPIAGFGLRAIGLAMLARIWFRPRFDLTGAGDIVRFGLAMVASSMFWFVQTQADVFIGGRHLDAHRLGLYTTALFLAQIVTAKFVPPMNEIAYAAYARLQTEPGAVAAAFLRALRLVMLVALPFYLGMAATAEPLVLTVLGPRWADAAPVVRVLALAMPLVTLQILFAPATNAIGRPRLALHGAMAGAAIMPVAFLLGVTHGPVGLALAWAAAFPLLCLYTATISLPAIGIGWRALWDAVRAPLVAAVAMGLVVAGFDRVLPPLPPLPRLALLVGVGAGTYAGLAWTLAGAQLRELVALVRGRR